VGRYLKAVSDTVKIVVEKDAGPLIGKPDKERPVDAQHLSSIALKILHSKICFKAFCETKMKICTFGLISCFGDLTVAQTGKNIGTI
jgi:hypothetical protein